MKATQRSLRVSEKVNHSLRQELLSLETEFEAAVMKKTEDGKIQIKCDEKGSDGKWADGLKDEGVFS